MAAVVVAVDVVVVVAVAAVAPAVGCCLPSLLRRLRLLIVVVL